MLTRSIDDPFELTIEEKIFHGAKRLCTIFAVVAVTLVTLDLMNIRSVEAAADFVHANRQRFAGLPDIIRSGIQSIALASPSAVALIPRGDVDIDIAMPSLFPRDTAMRAKTDTSPVAELAAARHLDAIEVAVEAPAAWTMPIAPIAEAAPAAPTMVLASADPAPLPLDHVVQHGTGGVDEAPHVDRDLLLPLLSRLLDEEAVHRPSRAVDEHVDSPQTFHRGGRHGGGRLPRGDVGHHHLHRCRRLGRGPGRARLVEVGDHYPRPFAGEAVDDRPADVGGATGDDHGSVPQLQFHGRTFSRLAERNPVPGGAQGEN